MTNIAKFTRESGEKWVPAYHDSVQKVDVALDVCECGWTHERGSLYGNDRNELELIKHRLDHLEGKFGIL